MAGASSSRPELELAFLLARTRAHRTASAARIRALAATVSEEQLARELARRRLLPLLGTRLLELAPDTVPARDDHFAARVAEAKAHARARALALEASTARVTRLLAVQGIRSLPLKGPGLAELVHGDPGLRISGDIDLLVGRDDLHRAAALLVADGYQPPTDRLDARGLPRLHLELAHPQRPGIDLHWRVTWHERDFSTGLLDDPSPLNTVAALLLFYARDGFYGLRLSTDIGGWWERHGPGLPPGALDGHAARHPELAPTWRAAAVAAERTAGVPATAWLSDAAPLDRRERLAVRLANWSWDGDPDQLAANIVLVDALLTPPGDGLQWTVRMLDGTPDGRRIPHAAKILSRNAAALWRVRRRSWTAAPTP